MSFSLHASDKVSVFILHSYSQEYEWTKKQHTSFVLTLNKSNHNFDFFTEYLDTKRVKLTAEYENEFIKYLKIKCADVNPDVIYVSDDNALNFIVKNRKKLFPNEKNIPIFFSGINNLDMQNTLSSESFAGVYEVKDIKPNIELIKQFSPQTRDIYFVGDNSNTDNSIKKEIKLQENKFPKLNFHYISDENISKIVSQLPNKSRNFVLLTTIGNFKDEKNSTLLPNASIQRIRENENLIILSMEDAYMYKGVVGGYMTSGTNQGTEAAKLVLQYLKEKSLKGVKSLIKSPNIYMFNSKELVNSRIVLSEYISREATIIGKDEYFLEKNKAMIFNFFIIILIILIFGIVAIYAVQKKKYFSQAIKLEELNNIKAKLHEKEQLLENIISFDNIGYWNLDINKDKLFVSKKLLEILGVDYSSYKDDSKLLSYFMDSKDKNIFNEKLSKVQKENEPLIFSHKVITSNKTVLNVTHCIYTENILDGVSSVVVGIMKFE